MYESRAEWQKAEAEYREINRLEPDNPWGWLMIGELYAKTGKMRHARQAFEKVIALVPCHAPGFTHLGDLCRSAGDFTVFTRLLPSGAQTRPFRKVRRRRTEANRKTKKAKPLDFAFFAMMEADSYFEMRRPGAKIILSKVRFSDLLWKFTIGGESGNSTTSPALTFVSITATHIFCPFSSTST